jgi:hypothetical protein
MFAFNLRFSFWIPERIVLPEGREVNSNRNMTAFGAVLRAWFSGALLGRDGVERGPT